MPGKFLWSKHLYALGRKGGVGFISAFVWETLKSSRILNPDPSGFRNPQQMHHPAPTRLRLPVDF